MEQGVDPAAVLAFVDAVDADPAVELHSLMVLRHGHVVAEGWWAPHTSERTRLLYSLSKSFTSTALAFAISEGLVRLDDTAVSHFPEFADEITDPRSRSITLRDLASMAAGHDHDMWQEARAARPRGTSPRIPPAAAGPATGHPLRLQPTVHLHARGHHPAPGRDAAERVPLPAAPRAARHRRGPLAVWAAGP